MGVKTKSGGGTEMDVGQIREERKMVISLWGPGSQAVSRPVGPQLELKIRLITKKKYPAVQNKNTNTNNVFPPFPIECNWTNLW